VVRQLHLYLTRGASAVEWVFCVGQRVTGRQGWLDLNQLIKIKGFFSTKIILLTINKKTNYIITSTGQSQALVKR
jgi:hypothetical protein